MSTLVGFLRAVNVTGTGKLLMDDLRKICGKCGFGDVRTYIASGNVVFASKVTAAKAKATLEAALLKKMGKPCQVVIRTADELEAILKANPYPEAEPNRCMVLFLDEPPAKAAKDALKTWKIPAHERMELRGRELFLHFPDGQGQSKLKVPFMTVGTGRNINTVRAMLAMARGEG